MLKLFEYNTIQQSIWYRASVCIFLDLGFNFHLEFRQYKFRSLPWFVCVNKLNLLYCLNKTFSSYSYIFSIEYFVNQIYHKTEIICKKRMIYKKETRRLISLSSRRRATSADIGREFHPLRLVWWNPANKGNVW